MQPTLPHFEHFEVGSSLPQNARDLAVLFSELSKLHTFLFFLETLPECCEDGLYSGLTFSQALRSFSAKQDPASMLRLERAYPGSWKWVFKGGGAIVAALVALNGLYKDLTWRNDVEKRGAQLSNAASEIQILRAADDLMKDLGFTSQERKREVADRLNRALATIYDQVEAKKISGARMLSSKQFAKEPFYKVSSDSLKKKAKKLPTRKALASAQPGKKKPPTKKVPGAEAAIVKKPVLKKKLTKKKAAAKRPGGTGNS